MENQSGKRIAKVRLTLTKRTVEALEPTDKPWIAWDDRLIGFGVRVQPSGTKTFIVNYRTGDGGRTAPNKRVAIGRYGRIAPDRARRLAQEVLGRVAGGDDPAGERAEARGMPTLADAFADYMAANPKRAANTVKLYRRNMRLNLSDWLTRPLDTITRRDVEARFNLITEERGWATGNQTLSMLRSIYRRPCVDHEGLRNPVELWLAGGGRFNRMRRRRISSPVEVLPRWWAGIEEAEGLTPVIRDIFLVGFYTGMRRGEIIGLRWERVDLEGRILRVEETKTGEPLELPITRQLAAIFDRRRADNGTPAELHGWVFPSRASASGHVEDTNRFYDGISDAGGTRFWFHGLRNCFITVAERELMLPRSLTKRLVNHARPGDVTEGYAADWTVDQLREPAQKVADRIDALMNVGAQPKSNLA